MPMMFKRTERTFSAAEVDEFFGVPEVTQRDWRRRPDARRFFRPAKKGKKFFFTLSEACMLALARVQTDAGKTVVGALTNALFSAELAKLQIELCQFGVAFECIEFDPAKKREVIYGLNEVQDDVSSTTRYIFFPAKGKLHSSLDGSPTDGATCYHFNSLAEMEMKVARDWVYGSIFDLEAFALSVSFKLREPLVTYRYVGGEE